MRLGTETTKGLIHTASSEDPLLEGLTIISIGPDCQK